MPVKEKLSGISLEALILAKTKLTRKIIIKDDSFRSSQFVIPQNRKSTSSFTGRTKELDYLRVQYSKTLQQIKNKISEEEKAFKPIITGIKGEPGIGKSRLMQEFLNRTVKLSAGKINNVVSGKNLKTSQNSLGPFAEIIPEFNQQKFLPGENGNYREAANYIKEKLFKKAEFLNSKGLPLVLAIEDMQWADENTLYILDQLLKAINLYGEGEQPLIFLMLNYRNSFKPTKVMRQESEYHELMLEALDEKNTFNLINNLTGSTKLNTKIRELIAVRADGNPFNIEEWCSLVTANKKLNRVPQTVRHLLVEKISGLTPGERSILIAACISGRKFDIRFVNEVLKRAGKAEAESDDIKNLEEKRYIINLTGSTYEFRHDILHETLYMQLEAGLRRELHKIAGEVTEKLYKSKLSEHFYELARHFSLAKDETKTIEYLEKAGDKAKGNYEHERALRFYRKLLQKLAEKQKFEVIFKMCDVHMNRSEWNKQIEQCNAILKTSRLLDKRIKAECYKRIGHALRLKGEYRKALSIYKKAFRIFENDKDVQGKLDIMEHEAKVMMVMGRYPETHNSFIQINHLAKNTGNKNAYTNSLIGLGIVNNKMGKYDLSLRYNEELYEFFKINKDKNGIVTSQINKAETLFLIKEYDAALNIYKKSLSFAKTHEQNQNISICLGNLGLIYYTKHKYKKSLPFFFRQLKLSILLGDKAGIARAYGNIGACYISIGQYKISLDYLEKQNKICKELKRKQSLSVCTGNIGTVYNFMGEYEKAIMFFKIQKKLDRSIGNSEGIYRAFVNIGITYKNLEKLHHAIRSFKKAIKHLEKIDKINTDLLYLKISEVYFELGNFKFSLKFANLGLSQNNRNNKLIFLKTIFMQFVNLLKITMNSNLRDKEKCRQKILKKYQELLSVIKKFNTVEENAIKYYELWKLANILKKFKIKINDTLARRKALYNYSKLFLNSRQIEYNNRIKELNANS